VTLDEQKATALALRRQSALLLLTVCGLSSVGLHGVTSYGVRRRARELGIRMALGAASHDVVTMVVRQALRLLRRFLLQKAIERHLKPARRAAAA
jgi:hypothetical protein